MKIVLYENESLFVEICEEWHDLLADSTANQIFLTCTWQASWWEAYHPGQICALALRDETTGRLVGLAPWFVETLLDGTRIVRAIGCVDVTDYLEVIARRGYEQAVFDALAAHVAAHREHFDEVRLCNVPEQSSTLALLPAALEQNGLPVTVNLQEVCPIIVLPELWEDYFALLSKKHRHELRRKLRRASGGPNERVDWYIVGPEHDLSTELERFLRLMRQSHPTKAAFLDEAGNETFFRLMVPRMAERGWLQLAFLTINGEAVASYLNFDYANRVVVYNSGMNPDAHGGLSAGIVLLARLIEHAIAERREVFDFLRGDEQYKYHMGGTDTKVFQIVVGAVAPA